ncbi:MAG TPA: phosphopantetheine-binding protein, partial [Thermoanaerobaculia bacterium]
HMVPGAIVAMDVLPLTNNGKLDRGALPAPSPENLLRQTGSPPPDGPVQSALADIWSRVLAIPTVGADDDFFALGGDSLGATRVMARLRDAFGVELPLRAIFECRTLARLAAAIDTARRAGTASPARPRIVPRSGRVSTAPKPAEDLEPKR